MEEYRKRNFQVMIQSTRQHHIYPYIFSRKLYLVIRPSSFWQEDFSDMYWNLSTKPIKELHTLLYIFVKGFNNEQSRSRIISNSINGETLLVSYKNYVLLWWCLWKKHLSLTFSLAKKKIFMQHSLNIHLKKELTDLFWNLPDIPFPHSQSRNRIVNTAYG